MKQRQRELLVSLRRQLSGKNHTLPFTVYTDKDIDALIEAQPKTIEALKTVKGFPPNGTRVKGYGEAIVAIFNDASRIAEITVSEGDTGEIVVGTTFRPITAF